MTINPGQSANGNNEAERNSFTGFRDYIKRNHSFGKNTMPDETEKFKKIMDEMISNSGIPLELNFKTIPVNLFDMLPAVVLTCLNKHTATVYFYTFYLPTQEQPILGPRLNVMQSFAEIIDMLRKEMNIYWAAAGADTASMNIHNVGETFIPWDKELDYLDDEVMGVMTRVAVSEIYERDMRISDLKPLNLSNLTHDSVFELKVDYQNKDLAQDLFARDIRSDVKLTLVEKSRSGRQGVNAFNPAGLEIATLCGYFDLVWEGGQPDNPITKYIPRFIITSIEAKSDELGFYLLMISMLGEVFDKYGWLKGFISQHEHPRGLNALVDLVRENLDVIPEHKHESMGFDDVVKLMQAVTYPNVVIAIDLPMMAGTDNGLEIFLAAKDNLEVARTELIEVIQNLTNGNFESHFNSTSLYKNMFINTNEPVIYGFFKRGSDGYVDLRHIDYLNVLKHLPKVNMDKFITLHSPMGVLPETSVGFGYAGAMSKLVATKKIVEGRLELAKQFPLDVKISDVGERLSFSREFFTALHRSVRDAGFNVRISEQNAVQLFSRARSGLI